MNRIPIGTVVSFCGDILPLGYLLLNGQEITRLDFPELCDILGFETSGNLPDLRGQFIRGLDNGKGLDVGRVLNSLQNQDFKSFSAANVGGSYAHQFYMGKNVGTHITASEVTALGTGLFTGEYGATPHGTRTQIRWDTSEIRPTNIAMNYIVKALHFETNGIEYEVAQGLNLKIEQLRNENDNFKQDVLGNISKQRNGYKVFPDGLIIQWGKHYCVKGPNIHTLPISFTSMDYSVVCGQYSYQSGKFACKNVSASQIDLHSETETSTDFWYIVIGY